MIPKSLKSGIILPLFKGKGAKANNKANYRRITLFPTCRKIYEMILLNRLDNFAAHKGFFSEMQFGSQEGVGSTEASFTVLETINHMLESSSKVFNCFLYTVCMFRKPWIQSVLGINLDLERINPYKSQQDYFSLLCILNYLKSI